MGRPPVAIEKRFWNFVTPQHESLCWEWQGNVRKNGYGVISRHGISSVRAHRVSYEIHYGKIDPPTLFVCHKCDNRKCVNPHHLFLGTIQDNNADRDRKGRVAKGNDHVRHKINEEMVQRILSEYDMIREVFDGRVPRATFRMICEKYKTNLHQLKQIVYRQTWKHVKSDGHDEPHVMQSHTEPCGIKEVNHE